MRELGDVQKEQLAELIAKKELKRALATIVVWAQAMDDSLPEGKTHCCLQSWKLHSDSLGPHTAPEPDSLQAFSASKALWFASSIFSLVPALEAEIANFQQQQSRHLVDGVSALGGEKFWLLRKHQGYGTRAQRLPDDIFALLKHLHFVPKQLDGLAVEICQTDSVLNARLAKCAEPSIGYLAHFEPFGIESINHGSGVQVTAVKDDAAHSRLALEHLAAAASAEATFFVLPECTVPPALRAQLCGAIASLQCPPPLTLAGGFHELQEGPAARCLNVCHLLDHRGLVLITHTKTQPAVLPGEAGVSAQEWIETHNTLHALATPLGLVGVAICIEYSHPNGRSLAAWTQVAPAWMLVASMGEKSTIDLHLTAARHLYATHKTISLIANQSPTGGAVHGLVFDANEGVQATDASLWVNRLVHLHRRKT